PFDLLPAIESAGGRPDRVRRLDRLGVDHRHGRQFGAPGAHPQLPAQPIDHPLGQTPGGPPLEERIHRLPRREIPPARPPPPPPPRAPPPAPPPPRPPPPPPPPAPPPPPPPATPPRTGLGSESRPPRPAAGESSDVRPGLAATRP